MEKEKKEICWYCYGKGTISRLQSYGRFSASRNETCHKCSGTGYIKKDN